MQILPISTNQPSFNGNITLKGNWPERLENSFLNNELIKDMFSKYDVVARLSTKKAPVSNLHHHKGQKLYKIRFSFLKENSKFDKILDSLHLKTRHPMTCNYHSEMGTEFCMDKMHLDRVLDDMA